MSSSRKTIGQNKMVLRLARGGFAMLIIALFTFPLKSQEDAVALNEEQIVGKLMEFYAKAKDYQASFVQTTAHKMFQGKLQRNYGKVKFKSGGLMRWEYNRPEVKVFIYDGKTLWLYEPEVPQVFSGATDTDRLKKALAFLTGEGDIIKEYRVKKLDEVKYGFKDGIVLGLWPKDLKSPFRRVEMYLNKDTFRVVRSVLVDHDGNRNRFDFYNTKVNSGLSQELFTFTPPPGVNVIKAPQQ